MTKVFSTEDTCWVKETDTDKSLEKEQLSPVGQQTTDFRHKLNRQPTNKTSILLIGARGDNKTTDTQYHSDMHMASQRYIPQSPSPLQVKHAIWAIQCK